MAKRDAPNPIVGRKRLGHTLKDLREAEDLLLADLASKVGWSESKLSRLENGKNVIKLIEIEKLLGKLKADDTTRRSVMDLAREARRPGWWHTYADSMPSWFETFVSMESEATTVREFEMRTLPGLVQTADYARAVLDVGAQPLPRDEIEKQVELRMARQTRLRGDNPPQYWLVLDEGVLRRSIGGPDVMHRQLAALTEFAQLPHVTVQILPFSAGAHMALAGPFLIWEIPDSPRVVHVDNLLSGIYYERRAETSPYALTWDHLIAKALDPDQTVSIIGQVASKLSEEHDDEEVRDVPR